MVRCLLKAFAGLDQATYEEETPLFTAALQGHSDVLNTLLEAKAQKDKTNKDGKSPLWILGSSWNLRSQQFRKGNQHEFVSTRTEHQDFVVHLF